MKKLLLAFVVLTFTLGLTACDLIGDTDIDPECTDLQELIDGECVDIDDPDPDPDTTAPVLTGVEDATVFVDSDFDPLDGITATDDTDGDITENIVVTGTVDTSVTGTYYLLYKITDAAGNSSQEARYITVEVDPSLIGDEMVPNGDFSLGWSIWMGEGGGVEGGVGTFTVVDEVLEVEITTPSWNMWEPRLSNRGITFENGTTYEITFDAKADAARSIHVQVGEILDAAPWFTDFKPGQQEIFDLSTDWQTFTFKFTMGLDTNENGALIFEMGTVEGGVGTDNLATTIYYDNIAIEESTPDPDTTAPVLSGVEDKTIEAGTPFDALEGVTAFDNLDGDIELTAAHVTGTVDVDTEGDYTLTYTVADAAGNETVETRVISVVALLFNDTNMVVNGDFETALGDPAEWVLYEANWSPTDSPMTDGTLSIDAGALKLEVVDIGTWGYQGWLLQASQDIEFATGMTYKVIFDAKADVARDINSVAGFQDTAANQWHQFGGGTFTLGTDYATYEYIFTVTEDGGDYAEVLKFEFGAAGDTVYVDNVKIQVLDTPELVKNGDFESTGWTVWSQDWDEGAGIPTVTSGIENGEFFVDIQDSIGNYDWSVQFAQDGIALEAGKQYKVTFDAYALTQARTINVRMMNGTTYATDLDEVFEISTTKTTYTFTFTQSIDDVVKYYFNLGLFTDGGDPVTNLSAPDKVFFDNLMIEEFDGTDVVADTNQVVNGTAEEVPYWMNWAQDWDEGAGTAAATYSVVDGELVADVTALGSYNWSVQFFQEGAVLVPGATYTVTFDAKASVARDINLKVIDGNAAEYTTSASLTTDMQTFTFTFVYDGTSTTGKLDFELGAAVTDSGIESSAIAVITIDNVMFYRNLNPQE